LFCNITDHLSSYELDIVPKPKDIHALIKACYEEQRTMSSADDIPLLERPSFFDGQRLLAHDLAAAQAYSRELRWLHNRSLHGWGIAFGCAVAGSRRAHSVKVDTGYAIDCIGRDLVLEIPIEMPIPSVASASDGGPVTYYLTVSYAEDAQLTPITRTGACNTSGAVRRPEMPLIRWQDPSDINPPSRYRYGLDVVLASIRVLNCQLAEDVSGRERRDAVPPQQPYVAAGRTTAGETAWQLWPNDNAALGVATTVSTSGAGFQTTPRYQAHVVGERIFQAAAGGEAFIADGYTQIAQATASSFELRVILPTGTTIGSGQTVLFTVGDYDAVVSRILPEIIPLTSSEHFRRMNGPRLTVGHSLKYEEVLSGSLRETTPLTEEDFRGPLTRIAVGKGSTLDALLGANGWELNTVSVAVGQILALPGPDLDLNPPEKVFKPEFMDVLKKDLAWHVVWMGVEG
jgi:hypothetical protein